MKQPIVICDPCIFRMATGELKFIGPEEADHLARAVERISACTKAGLRPADLDITAVETLPVFCQEVLDSEPFLIVSNKR